jgi:methyl-accepting chemotaxis protein
MQRAGRGGFFAYHGVWAPGVRLFRKVGFRIKAALITAAFVLPLVVVLWAYLGQAQQGIRVAQQERAGVAILQATELWVAEVQQQRARLITGQQKSFDASALQNHRQAVSQAVQAHADTLLMTEAWGQLGQAHQQAAATPVAAAQAHLDALVAWRGAVLDRSQLTLDPDQDTYYLMSVATAPVAELLDKLSLASAQARAFAVQGATPSVAALRPLMGWWTVSQQSAAQVPDQLARSAQAHAPVAQRVSHKDAEQAVGRWLAAAEAQWFGSAFDGAAALPTQAALDALLALQASSFKLLDERLADRMAQFEAGRWPMLIACALSLLLAGYLLHCFYRVMEGGLNEVGRHLSAMTQGDLTTSPRPWGKDEAARLMLLLSEMQASLRSMVQQVRRASDGIVHTSSEIAEGAMDLSARTEQTAANLEESASAMEQISATVRQTADHAQEATHIASHNADVAARGGEVIANMVNTMQGIHGSSSKIGDIIGVIDSIAFQTNILALNAAVEAARAGEQGRGFAVVASEVRALAQRSAAAAREIKALISVSVEQVAGGAVIVRDAGSTIEEIVQSAQRVNTLLSDIAIGSREQSQGVSQVGDAVQDLDRVTQQNAALVEQTAAAAATLKDQALQLATEVARFKLS